MGYSGTSEATAYFSATYAMYLTSVGKDSVIATINSYAKDNGAPGRDDYYGIGVLTNMVFNPDTLDIVNELRDSRFKDSILEYTNEELMQMSPSDLDYLFQHRDPYDVGVILTQATPEQHKYFLDSSPYLTDTYWLKDWATEEPKSYDEDPSLYAVTYKYLESMVKGDGIYCKLTIPAKRTQGVSYISNTVAGVGVSTYTIYFNIIIRTIVRTFYELLYIYHFLRCFFDYFLNISWSTCPLIHFIV